MYTLKKKLKPTCTAHYLGKGFPRACRNLHGHNYNYEIEIGAKELDQWDMGIDFAEIKTICDNWLQKNFDHKTLFSSFQTTAIDFWEKMGWSYTIFPIESRNTTAESMAEYLAALFFKELTAVCPSLEYVTMRVQETEGSVAEYTYRRKTDEI